MALIERIAPKVISAKTHGIIDYVHAGANFLAGALLWGRDRRASTGAFVLGASVLANALMTDYPLGVFRLYSFRTHGALDYSVAGASAALPRLLGIGDGAANTFFRLQGSGETLIAAMTDYSDRTGAKHRLGVSRRRAA